MPWDGFETDSYQILVEGYYYDEPGAMVDEHLTELFPSLVLIDGLEDLCEGVMEYSGELYPEDLIKELIKLGFDVDDQTDKNIIKKP